MRIPIAVRTITLIPPTGFFRYIANWSTSFPPTTIIYRYHLPKSYCSISRPVLLVIFLNVEINGFLLVPHPFLRVVNILPPTRASANVSAYLQPDPSSLNIVGTLPTTLVDTDPLHPISITDPLLATDFPLVSGEAEADETLPWHEALLITVTDRLTDRTAFIDTRHTDVGSAGGLSSCVASGNATMPWLPTATPAVALAPV